MTTKQIQAKIKQTTAVITKRQEELTALKEKRKGLQAALAETKVAKEKGKTPVAAGVGKDEAE